MANLKLKDPISEESLFLPTKSVKLIEEKNMWAKRVEDLKINKHVIISPDKLNEFLNYLANSCGIIIDNITPVYQIGVDITEDGDNEAVVLRHYWVEYAD